MGDRDRLNSLLTRRAFVEVVGKGAIVVAVGGLLRFFEPERKFMRPPGAVPEAEFLALCNRCLKCQEECPTMIVPVLLTESIIGVGTPRMLFSCGRCMRCAAVCPTGALQVGRR